MLAWQSARQQAANILRAGRVGPGLSDLYDIAAQWEATVSVTRLDEGISGFIIKDADEPPRIYINSEENAQRQRFTLAHEIGHLIDRDQIANDLEYSFMDYRSNKNYDLHEFFADEFAGALLMPEPDVLDCVEAEGKYVAARHFDVSIPALDRRLMRLEKDPTPRQ